MEEDTKRTIIWAVCIFTCVLCVCAASVGGCRAYYDYQFKMHQAGFVEKPDTDYRSTHWEKTQ